jgi:hypothetical protein
MSDAARCHRLRSLSVVGGFLDGLEIELAGGLNCLIGPRGAGKTTALEYVRHVLDAPGGGQPADAQDRRGSLVADSLGAGRIRLRIETKDGIEYTVDRTAMGAPLAMDAAGNPSEVTLTGGGVFRADRACIPSSIAGDSNLRPTGYQHCFRRGHKTVRSATSDDLAERTQLSPGRLSAGCFSRQSRGENRRRSRCAVSEYRGWIPQTVHGPTVSGIRARRCHLLSMLLFSNVSDRFC